MKREGPPLLCELARFVSFDRAPGADGIRERFMNRMNQAIAQALSNIGPRRRVETIVLTDRPRVSDTPEYYVAIWYEVTKREKRAAERFTQRSFKAKK